MPRFALICLPVAAAHVAISITDQILEPAFMGIGFDLLAGLEAMDKDFFNEIYGKRLQEFRPGFVRMDPGVTSSVQVQKNVNRTLQVLGDIGSTIYFTTFTAPYINASRHAESLAVYADKVVGVLAQHVAVAPESVRYYCWTNELSLCVPWDCGPPNNGWASLVRGKRFDIWEAYHRAFHASLARAGLDASIGLGATDASPIEYWDSMDWALENVDDVTAIYEAHHYPAANTSAMDQRFYSYWLDEVSKTAEKIRSRVGKRFIVGETGGPQWTLEHPAQAGRYNCDRWDGCAWFDTPEEPYGALQLAEQAAGAVNGGAAALAWWTFFSGYIPSGQQQTSCNDWGASRWNGTDSRTRMHYPAVGMISQAFQGPGASVVSTSTHPSVRVAAMRKPTGAWSLLVINRLPESMNISLSLPADLVSRRVVRRYSYAAASAGERSSPFGDLPGPERFLSDLSGGVLFDDISPSSVTVYTTDFEDSCPPAVQNVALASVPGGARLSWDSSPAVAKVAYYRVFRKTSNNSHVQVRSTIATDCMVPASSFVDEYSVVAVDRWNNAGCGDTIVNYLESFI